MAVTEPDVTAPPRLAQLPTPLHEAPRLADALGIAGRLLVKRDDLIGFALAGNKTRPLEALLAAALDAGADLLVTGGTTSSNFCAAATAAARWAGLDCVLVYAGTEPTTPHPNLAAAARWGAELLWTGVEDRASVDAAIEQTAQALRSAGRSPYVMPRGGATPLGATGFHRAALELDQQLGPDRAGDTLVVVATGSGATAAGLLAGAAAAVSPLRVLAASVSRPPDETTSRVLAIAQGCAVLMGTPRPDPASLVLHDARGPGHGIPSDAGVLAAALALETEGLVLDPVYTAKALGALPGLVGASIGDAAAATVFWHTGGMLDAVAEWGS